MNSSNLKYCQRYRGCKWSSRTDYRKTFCPLNDYPGPGTYFTSMNDEWIRLITRGLQQNLTNSKRVLNVPRFIEKHVRDAKHENLPPPGLYFADESQRRRINTHRPPFATSAPRFPPGDLTSPGPGTYNINRDKFDSLCTLRNQKRIPFLSSGTRMSKEKTKPTPGPFAYKIPGMTEKMLLRLKRKEVGLKVPFDSSSGRITMTAAKRCEGPGPYDYYPKPQPECRRKIPEKTSISRKNSDSCAPIERKRCPPPTTYDVTMAFKALKDHRSFRASRRDQSNEAFLCSSPRFTKYTEGVAGFIANPGPGAYCVKRDPQPKCGTFRRTEERFRDVDNGQPGPADYKLDPAVGSSVYIRTFNATLRRRTTSAPAHVKH
ncbi:hypothetical protein EmuJ_000069800 [Echinococcus multilocularis]|uniref:Uncharacterized protein n=1 Tax=Echinococcus multilocularis TaxID=6211 RepID=A0A087VXF7_ECHMU|nr:hypothetical protein EmuJ_000069800 [Echinococcus multilocularis]